MGNELGHMFDSLGWAILHSFWQGALAALVVFLFRSLTKDSHAALRYGFQLICLCLCLIAFMATFAVYQLRAGPETLIFAGGTPSFASLTALFADGQGLISAGGAASDGAGWTHLLAAYAPLLGIVWCLGFMLAAMRYTGAFFLTQQLRRTGITPVKPEWQRRFSTLVKNSGIRREVKIFISSRVSSPLTLGFFKPIVLVPASFFAGLPAVQVDAILLHEIAHIRRHDYIFNLLQTAIKTIFFFHPAIHYMSRKIDNDREHACDDFAVALTRDPQSLARGLASLRMEIARNRFALAADNGQTPLVNRLNRLGGGSQSRRRPEHVLTSVLSLLLVGGLYVGTSPLADAHPMHTANPEPAHPSGKLSNYRFEQITQNGRTFTAKIADNGSRWINVDGVWHDIDTRPDMINALPITPKMPTPVFKANNNASSQSQYKIDLDYYIARLQNDAVSAGQAANNARLENAKRLRDDAQRQLRTDITKTKASSEADWTSADILAGGPPAPTPPIAPGIYLNGNQMQFSDSQVWTQDFKREMQRIETDVATGVLTEHKAEHARDRAEARLEQNIKRAEQQMERAQQQRERAWEQAEASRERAEAARERAEAMRERSLERAAQARERAIEARQEARERAQEQREHKLEHAERARRNSHHSNTQKFTRFSKVMLAQLKSDGLIARNATSVEITYPHKSMHVNGQSVPDNMVNPYCNLLEAYGLTKSHNTRIDITPAYFKYTSKTDNHRRTITETFKPHKDAALKAPSTWTEGSLQLPQSFIKSASFVHPTPSSQIKLGYAASNADGHAHYGIDLAAPLSTPVLASAEGTVISAKPHGKWGKEIKISHPDGYETRYAHVGEICVEEGDKVKQGDYIAQVGMTGETSRPHLHFEIRRYGQAQNPEDLISGT